MLDKAVIEKLIDQIPLAVIVIGVVVFISGAIGGLPLCDPPLQITEFGWRVAIATMGTVLTSTGLILVWGARKKSGPQLSHRNQHPWSNNKTLKPGLEAAKELELAIEVLGDMHLWLSTNNNSSIGETQDKLWEVVNDLRQERDVYVVLYDQYIKDRLWALGRLSQIEKSKAKAVMQWIIDHPYITAQIRDAAKRHLEEINKREE